MIKGYKRKNYLVLCQVRKNFCKTIEDSYVVNKIFPCGQKQKIKLGTGRPTCTPVTLAYGQKYDYQVIAITMDVLNNSKSKKNVNNTGNKQEEIIIIIIVMTVMTIIFITIFILF